MMNYEFMKYLTIFMEGYQRTAKDSVMQHISGTGFFASIDINGKKTNVILTANHFAEKLNRVTFWLRYMDEDRMVTVPISSKVEWNYCEDADIAYCELEPIAKRFKKITGRNIYATVVTEDRILKQDELENIHLLDEVITAGYPNGEATTHHKFPIFKKGYIASLPKDCVEDKEGYIDLSAMGGCSGSPVFLDTTPLKFLGMLVSGAADSSSESSCVSMYVPGYMVLDFVKEF